MTEVKEALRARLAGLGKRPAARRAGVNGPLTSDRETGMELLEHRKAQ